IESAIHVLVSRPKAMTNHFVRISLSGDGVGFRTFRRQPARKTSDGQVKTSPEKMYRAALADEARAKLLHYLVHLHEGTPKTIRIFRVIRSVNLVFFKANWIRYFDRHGPNLDLHAETVQRCHDFSVKIRYGLRPQFEGSCSTIAALD